MLRCEFIAEKQKGGAKMLVKKSEVKDKVKGDMRISGDFYDALDKHVANAIKAAEKRAKENGRKTLKPHDL